MAGPGPVLHDFGEIQRRGWPTQGRAWRRFGGEASLPKHSHPSSRSQKGWRTTGTRHLERGMAHAGAVRSSRQRGTAAPPVELKGARSDDSLGRYPVIGAACPIRSGKLSRITAVVRVLQRRQWQLHLPKDGRAPGGLRHVALVPVDASGGGRRRGCRHVFVRKEGIPLLSPSATGPSTRYRTVACSRSQCGSERAGGERSCLRRHPGRRRSRSAGIACRIELDAIPDTASRPFRDDAGEGADPPQLSRLLSRSHRVGGETGKGRPAA